MTGQGRILVVDDAERMRRACAELLDVATLSEARVQHSKKPFDRIIQLALAQMIERASGMGVQIELNLASEALVHVDPEHLHRALLNLAINAIEAMPDGGFLRASSFREGDWAVVLISDTGDGIPEEVRQRMFEPFVSSGKPGGSGLGLTVVRAVIEEHGGLVEVEKAEGGGTTFRLRLPVTVESDS